MRLADALIKANKDFDLVVVPGAGHGMGGAYGERRMQDFFVRHLQPTSTTPTADAQLLAAADPGPPAASEGGDASRPLPVHAPLLAELNDGTDFRGVIERYTVDRRSVYRTKATMTPALEAKLKELYNERLAQLASLDFDALEHDAQVDYLLLKNHIQQKLRQQELEAKARESTAALTTFENGIIELEEARRDVKPMNWAEVASTLAKLPKQIDEARSAAEERQRGDGKVKKTVANRAAGRVDALRSALRNWHAFYNGYDPSFTWWMDEPYKRADEALTNYATFLRTRLAGRPAGASPETATAGAGESRRGGRRSGGPPAERTAPSSSDSTPAADDAHRAGGDIVGDPIGHDALVSELGFEMIPYSPEELIALAEKEYAWCEAEMIKASRDLGYGDDWHAALEHVKKLHVEPGKQPELINDLAVEAMAFLDKHDLVTVPPLCRESWRMAMMSPERQLVSPFFTGGETITVSFPTGAMPHEAKMMSLRGNNIHFSRATVQHELIPGHHLQAYMTARYKPYREIFDTPFWTEGWALYWEMLLWDLNFPQTPENRIGMLFWRMHRCVRIVFSLSFHLEKLTPQECIEMLVKRVGHERDNATAEVRRSFEGSYVPLYQAAYMLGGLQFRAMHRDLVQSGKMTNREFHDAILRENRIPVDMVRVILTKQPLTRDYKSSWKFYENQ